MNSLEAISENGIILTHDNNPPPFTWMPRHHVDWTSPKRCGDSWKTIPLLRTREDLDVCTFEGDFGVGIIKKSKNRSPLVLKREHGLYEAVNQKNLEEPDFSLFDYNQLCQDRRGILNLLTVEETIKWLE